MGFKDVQMDPQKKDTMTVMGYSILLGFTILICWPFTIKCFYIIKRDYKLPYIIKRKPILIKAILTLASINMFITTPFMSILNIYCKNTWNIPQYFYFLITYINKSCLLGVMWLFVLRVHLLYMDFGYNKAMSNKNWIKIINNNYLNSNWFIKHKNTLGNVKYMSKLALVIIFTSILGYILIDVLL